ncbi:MAG TPA: hypothetical protein VGK50_08965 [Coriobacteriia bacterium]|jgi:hypothetical protein
MPAVDDDTLPTLMRMFDMLFRDRRSVSRLAVLQAAEVMSLPDDVLALFGLLPPGTYSRRRLADQLNSIIVGHGLGRTLGTVE